MKHLYVACFVLMAGCVKEKITAYKAYIKNNTNHRIRMTGFHGGIVLPNDSLRLNPNDSIQIANSFDRGILNKAGFQSNYFVNADSIQVEFDGIVRSTHYFQTPPVFAKSYYLYTSPRNLLQLNSYEYQYEDVSKYQRNSKYTYTFLEQDYLDAK